MPRRVICAETNALCRACPDWDLSPVLSTLGAKLRECRHADTCSVNVCPIARCGDGSNDVGALRRSHVGLALLSGFGDANTAVDVTTNKTETQGSADQTGPADAGPGEKAVGEEREDRKASGALIGKSKEEIQKEERERIQVLAASVILPVHGFRVSQVCTGCVSLSTRRAFNCFHTRSLSYGLFREFVLIATAPSENLGMARRPLSVPLLKFPCYMTREKLVPKPCRIRKREILEQLLLIAMRTNICREPPFFGGRACLILWNTVGKRGCLKPLKWAAARVSLASLDLQAVPFSLECQQKANVFENTLGVATLPPPLVLICFFTYFQPLRRTSRWSLSGCEAKASAPQKPCGKPPKSRRKSE